MASSLPSLQIFATLNNQSNKEEIQSSVAAVIQDLNKTVKNTPDTAKARKSIADLLDFLNSLRSTVHPGRVELAQSISQQIIPLLYEKEDTDEEVDDYKHLRAEYLLINFVSNAIGDTLALLRGELSQHPNFRLGRREEIVPPFCLFSTLYASGIRDLLTKLIIVRFRNPRIESTIYTPLKRDFIDQGKNPSIYFEENRLHIKEQVTKLLDWAASVEVGLRDNKAGMNTKGQSRSTEYSSEDCLIQELLDKLKLHSEINEYFLPRSAGFNILSHLYSLNRGRFVNAVKEIVNATKYGNDHNQVVLQLDALLNDMGELDFDISALSAHYIGNEKSRMTYRALMDCCIGSGRTRELMIEARPLISAEIGRQPIHLAKQIVSDTSKTTGDLPKMQEQLEYFRNIIREINKVRFEQELKACASIFLSSNIMRPLAQWIESENAEEGTFFLRTQQIEIALKKKWNI
ncbi:hypothetical protein [Kiloniella antarctica]|uniref:Uncharacterized protein n=1 Tax=Kiloniella antarctica TaxID=1550907 RepID=A0ABW5BKN4_9PROT